jgi:hypothetical protein
MLEEIPLACKKKEKVREHKARQRVTSNQSMKPTAPFATGVQRVCYGTWRGLSLSR